jgi:hypothetical protein
MISSISIHSFSTCRQLTMSVQAGENRSCQLTVNQTATGSSESRIAAVSNDQ